MSEERRIICTACPVGCFMIVKEEDGHVVSISGNSCPRGEEYAKIEMTNPRRVFASTVRVEGGALPVCPVRSKEPVPKDKIFEITKAVAHVTVKAPLEIGQVIIKNVCDTGVDIVASRSLPTKQSVELISQGG